MENNETIATQIERVINTSCFYPTKEAYKFAINAHRYLQNQMAKFCIEYLLMLGEMKQTQQFDERNQDAATLGEEMIKLTEAVARSTGHQYPQMEAAIYRHHMNIENKKIENKFY